MKIGRFSGKKENQKYDSKRHQTRFHRIINIKYCKIIEKKHEVVDMTFGY